jgi:SHAQKYF class myb-like DNA-binding protein
MDARFGTNFPSVTVVATNGMPQLISLPYLAGFLVDEDDNTKTGRWTTEEHQKFLEAYEIFGKDWKKIAEFIGTRSNVQCRTHAQKCLKKESTNNKVPSASRPRIPGKSVSNTSYEGDDVSSVSEANTDSKSKLHEDNATIEPTKDSLKTASQTEHGIAASSTGRSAAMPKTFPIFSPIPSSQGMFQQTQGPFVFRAMPHSTSAPLASLQFPLHYRSNGMTNLSYPSVNPLMTSQLNFLSLSNGQVAYPTIMPVGNRNGPPFF